MEIKGSIFVQFPGEAGLDQSIRLTLLHQLNPIRDPLPLRHNTIPPPKRPTTIMGANSKTVAFFGASTGIGLSALKHTLAAGHNCIALCRTPSKLSAIFPPGVPNLKIVEGNACTRYRQRVQVPARR